MALSRNMTVRYKIRPNKMALWNEFLPSIEEPERSDVPTKSSKADDKEGMTIKSKYTKYTACMIWLHVVFLFCFFFSLFYFQVTINQIESI